MTKGEHHYIAKRFMSRDRIEDEIDEAVAPEAFFFVEGIQTIEQHVLQIIFACTPPTKWNGDIVLYTAGDIECATLVGWTTVYRDEGQTVYLSDDGSVYQPPVPDTGGEILPSEP